MSGETSGNGRAAIVRAFFEAYPDDEEIDVHIACIKFNCNKATAYKTLRHLTYKGYLERVPGVGRPGAWRKATK